MQPLGPKPIYLNDVKLENIDEANAKPPQTFLQKYVSVELLMLCIFQSKNDDVAHFIEVLLIILLTYSFLFASGILLLFSSFT